MVSLTIQQRLMLQDDVLDPHSPPRNRTIFGFLFVCKLPTTPFLVRLRDLHTSQSETYKAEILHSFAPFG
jgi:hypothetical protein